ncbi:unnamed protein product [Somion occarium]|uniref:F-box domain-containing protein n=1 Tax=Somion occarium TaxID=3059160 RepID=A0ABP1DBC9_9APHY
MNMAAAIQNPLTLPTLLDPLSWQLPGWNEPLTSHELESHPDDSTLDKLDSSLALLSRYRNSLRPFNRLSSDILVLIFSELVAGHADPYDVKFGSYPWMGVAQVCHFWRQVALTTPILWTHLSTRYCTAALACIERSAEAALSLYICESSKDEKISQVLSAVQPHIARLRHLYVPSNMLKDDNDHIHQVLQPLVNSTAPALETFETIKIRANAGWIPMPALFTGSTPSLTRLKVHFMLPQLRSVTFGKLQVLSFTGRKHTPITLPASELLDILEACPLLQSLKTEKVNFTPARDNESRKIPLDHLQVLQLGRTKASAVADIMKRLIIPGCAIRLKVHFDRYEDNKFYMGIPLPHELELNHPLRDIRKFYVQFMNGYEGVEIFGSTAHHPFHIHGFVEQDTLSNLGDMDTIAGTVFQSIIKAFDLEAVEDFAMTEYRNNYRWTGLNKKNWMDTFRRMPKLKVFRLTSDGSYDEGYSRAILAALSERDERTGNLFCPQLDAIDVNGDKTWSSLQCYIIAKDRLENGHPLKRVSMRLGHYASFSDSADTDLPRLREYVEQVDLEPQDIELPPFPKSP